MKRPVISELLVGTVLNRHLVLEDVSVFKQQEVVGFINVALLPETLSQLIGQDLSKGWIAGLVGSDGRRRDLKTLRHGYAGKNVIPVLPSHHSSTSGFMRLSAWG